MVTIQTTRRLLIMRSITLQMQLVRAIGPVWTLTEAVNMAQNQPVWTLTEVVNMAQNQPVWTLTEAVNMAQNQPVWRLLDVVQSV